jgi:RimJ/RimL family protein N-acetyltransferase
MQIRKAAAADLQQMQEIYDRARAFMAEHGNPDQWGTAYPSRSLLEQDIAAGNSYLCTDRGKPVGVFFFQAGPDPTYGRIKDGAWLNDDPYHVVHRFASAGGRKGIAGFCLDWCFSQSGNIRIDTHRDNSPMQNLLRKNGYTRCGIIYLENGEERIAFQRA